MHITEGFKLLSIHVQVYLSVNIMTNLFSDVNPDVIIEYVK